MESNVVIGPLNLIGGAFISQVSLIFFLLIAAFRLDDGRESVFSLVAVSVISTLSITSLVMSDVFIELWGPLLGGIGALLSWQHALIVFFCLNILLSTVLVFATGGGANSPFQALYFLLPTLAIFLREPVWHVILYTALVFVSFSMSMIKSPISNFLGSGGSLNTRKLATWIVSVACFLIAVVVGLATRPH